MRDGGGGGEELVADGAVGVVVSELLEELSRKDDMLVESSERTEVMPTPTPPALSSAESLCWGDLGASSRLAPRLRSEDLVLLFMVDVIPVAVALRRLLFFCVD